MNQSSEANMDQSSEATPPREVIRCLLLGGPTLQAPVFRTMRECKTFLSYFPPGNFPYKRRLEVYWVQAAFTSYALPLAALILRQTTVPPVAFRLLSYLPNSSELPFLQLFQDMFWEDNDERGWTL